MTAGVPGPVECPACAALAPCNARPYCEHPAASAPRFIVAEMSKNWINGIPMSPGLLCQKFELVILGNWERGYRLHSFQVHRLIAGPGELNETIIAVFERRDEGQP